MRFEDDVIAVLTDAGVGVGNVNLFACTEAEIPLLASGLPTLQFRTLPSPAGLLVQNETTRPGYLMPKGAINCRADDFETAYDMAAAAFDALTAVLNQTVNSNWYLWMRPDQSMPYDMGRDGRKQALVRFTLTARMKRDSGSTPMADQLLAIFGGDSFVFVTPSVSDAYPSGATFDKLVPDSQTVVLNKLRFPNGGNIYFEASARVSDVGARAKVALVDMSAPDTPIAELTFAADETIGARLRSGPLSLAASDKTYGVKVTCNSITVQAAAWGCNILRST